MPGTVPSARDTDKSKIKSPFSGNSKGLYICQHVYIS